MTWGNDKPIIADDNGDDGKILKRETMKVIGSVCSQCGGVDGKHENVCAETN